MTHRGSRDRGSALMIATIIVLIVAAIAAAFFSITVRRNTVTYDASQSEIAFRIAQSGIDATIFQMNNYTYSSTSTLPPTGTSTGTPAVTGTINGGAYAVTITPAFDGSSGPFTLNSVGTYGNLGNGAPAKRGIHAVVGPNPGGSLFKYGMFGNINITDTGSVFIDSYKSGTGAYGAQATNYDSTHKKWYANTQGNIGSNGGISLSGGITIYGSATPGPTSSVTASGGAWVYGSTAPASSDQSQPLPPYTPTVASSGAFVQSGGTQTLTAGTYRYDSMSMSGSSNLIISGNVTLYLDGSFSQSGQATMTLAAGAQVTIYQKTGSFSLSGGGLINTSQIPSNFLLESQSTYTVDISGNSDFYGAVYAPLAPLKPSGSASTYGAFSTNSINISGGATFHYDESLASFPGAKIIYAVTEWNEYAP